jgi:TonB family protein
VQSSQASVEVCSHEPSPSFGNPHSRHCAAGAPRRCAGPLAHRDRRAPPALAERLQEEWLADLAERCGPVARLRLALGCCWATGIIAHEHAAAGVLAATSSSGAKLLHPLSRHESSFLPRRTAAFSIIIGVHVLVIGTFVAGLARTVIPHHEPETTVHFTYEHPPVAPPPPERRVNLSLPVIEAPPPLVPFDPVVGDGAIRPITSGPPRVLPPPSRAPVRIDGGPGAGFPATDDFYPAAARRLAEKGVATVHVCVDPHGRLSADPAIAQSSSSARLDDGALKLARAGSGHYRASTEDGRPISACYAFRIRFQFRD